MNSKDFVLWFGGFVDAVEGIPTQAQWDLLKNKLSEVGEPITFPSGPITRDRGTWPNTTPWENPYKVTCDSQVILTTTSGSGGTYNIPGITTNGNTTWTNIPKGANISYTLDL
jgi:hypothetical protein